MPRIILTPIAIEDSERLRLFLRKKNPIAAQRATTAIREAIRSLAIYPQANRARADNSRLRELIIPFGDSGYIALYEYIVAQDVVYVLGIKHKREHDFE